MIWYFEKDVIRGTTVWTCADIFKVEIKELDMPDGDHQSYLFIPLTRHLKNCDRALTEFCDKFRLDEGEKEAANSAIKRGETFYCEH